MDLGSNGIDFESFPWTNNLCKHGFTGFNPCSWQMGCQESWGIHFDSQMNQSVIQNRLCVAGEMVQPLKGRFTTKMSKQALWWE